MTDFGDKIKAGISLLDSEKPGWRDLINVGTLDLANCDVCVLGQVFGNYSEGLSQLGIGGGYAYGFDTSSDKMGELTEAWTEALGENNVLVEKGDVYKDKYGYAVKVIQTHILDIGDKSTIVYVVQTGTVSGSNFTAYNGGKDLLALQKADFEDGGVYNIKVEDKLTVKAGMFLVNDDRETFYAISNSEVRPLRDGAYTVRLSTIDQNGLRELTIPGGAKFSDRLVK